MRAATQTADQALLLAERMRFMLSRMPYIIRVQTRLGASELTSDALRRFDEVRKELPSSADTKTLIRDLSTLVTNGRETSQEAKAMLETLKPIVDWLPPPEEMHRLLDRIDGLDDKTLLALARLERVLGQVDALMPNDMPSIGTTVSAAGKRLDGLTRRILGYLVLLGATWTLLFWGGYALARGSVERRKARG